MAAGVLRKSNSKLGIAARSGNEERRVIFASRATNYQRLNDATIIPVLTLPSVDELLDSLGGSNSKVFSVF